MFGALYADCVRKEDFSNAMAGYIKKSMADRKLIRDITEQKMRASADSSRFFRPTPAAQTMFRKITTSLLEGANSKGVVKTLYSGKKLLASFLVVPPENSDFFIPMQQVHLTMAPYSRKARLWMMNQVSDHSALFRKDTSLYLMNSEFELMDFLYNSGFHIRSRATMGDPLVALNGLVSAYDPPKNLDHLELVIRPPEMKDLDTILQITRKEFSRNPQFGWFAASKQYLKSAKERIGREIKSPKSKGTQLAVYSKRGRLLGHSGMYVSKTPMYGLASGADITLDQSIQGKGIAKTLYRMTLEELVRRKVKIFRGGTSQPGMLKLNQVMGRRTHGYLMQSGKGFFPRKHFFQFDTK